MSARLVEILTARERSRRDQSLAAAMHAASLAELERECAALDAFRRGDFSPYERVRALFFLHALHRFHLPPLLAGRAPGRVPSAGVALLYDRRFGEAIDAFLAARDAQGATDAISSALAAAYRALGFQTLADQVRASVRGAAGNRWMFRCGHPADQPLRLRPELAAGAALVERTPVRMDLSHSGWSDIFFLGMDFPEGARVVNASIDLAVHGQGAAPAPPVEARVRAIDRPCLRLVSIDLGAAAEIRELAEVFDFARDHLGLLKAALIASGVVPPGLEGSGARLAELLARVVGRGRGLELVSHVHGIPKGSRLAVSTSLLCSLIAALMRATGQAASLEGPLSERERRTVAARAILGEWLAGSGGGWQDSGGLWPGLKLIAGELAASGDPEHGASRGRLLPGHRLLGSAEVDPRGRAELLASLVLVHGGMAQDVGPVLEMVTERYLLRSETEWKARKRAGAILDEILAELARGDARAVARLTDENFAGPIQTIIPWAGNAYTERLIERTRAQFGPRFRGFWMLGGMSGGGMGFFFDPEIRDEASEWLLEAMRAAKRELEHALPFAMEPVVYDCAIDERGSSAELMDADAVASPSGPKSAAEPATPARTLDQLLSEAGFDRDAHERLRSELRAGAIGLAQNRLPHTARIEDARPGDVLAMSADDRARLEKLGRAALESGQVAVVTLAGGSGSRWTQGAGVVKALSPFARLAGRHRSFLEVHLAKSRRASRLFGAPVPHVVTTSYLTHDAIEAELARRDRFGYEGPLLVSRGRSIGLRLVPMARDLAFAWYERATERLDERAQKLRESAQAALLDWARAAGESSDYTDNLPGQCVNPIGHGHEVPNLLLSGTLAALIAARPGLRTLLLHNVDTLGSDLDPALLGLHLESGACLSFEVVPRRINDQGGGLARVDGRLRLVESLALPRDEDGWRLSYYNSMTTWIDVDRLLAWFGLARTELRDEKRVRTAVRRAVERLPTYVTLKDVKKRWGLGQEDVFPVAQYEKLWGDMSAVPDVPCRFLAVDRMRGQQLKEPAELDGWLRDGSAAHVESLCEWT